MSLIYIASKFKLKAEVEELYRMLTELGHFVTVKWWDFECKKQLDYLEGEGFYNHKIPMFCRKRDLFGIREANIFVIRASTKKEMDFNGAHFEMGYATALKKSICIIGKVGRSSIYCGVEFFDSDEDFLGMIGEGF